MADAERTLIVGAKLKDEVSKNLDKMGKEGKKTGESIAWGFAKATVALGALKTAASAIGKFLADITVNAATTGDEIAKMSKSLGISTETLSTWGYAAELSGATTQQLGKALSLLGKQAFDASRGTGEGKVAFDALGISVKDASGRLRSAESIFLEVADKIRGLSDVNTKGALAMKLFGEAGVALVPMLEGGSAKIRQMAEEADFLGIKLTGAEAAMAEKFKDAQTKLNASVDGIKKAIATNLMPGLTEAFDGLADVFARNRKSISDAITGLVEGAIPALLEFGSKIIHIAQRVGEAFGVVIDGLKWMSSSFGTLKEIAQSALGGIKFFDPKRPELGTFNTEKELEAARALADGTKETAKAAQTAAEQYDEWKDKVLAAFEAAKKTRELMAQQPGLVKATTDTTGAVVEGVVEQARAATDALMMFFSTAKDGEGAAKAIGDTAEKMKQVEAEKVVEAARAMSQIGKELGGVAQAIRTATLSFVDLFTMIETSAPKAAAAFSKFAEAVRGSAVSVSTRESASATVPVQPMASGGIVTRPTFALIGESGPEAVIPLRAAKSFGGGPVSITMNVQASPGMDTQQLSEWTAEALVRRMRASKSLRSEMRRGIGGAL